MTPPTLDAIVMALIWWESPLQSLSQLASDLLPVLLEILLRSLLLFSFCAPGTDSQLILPSPGTQEF